MKSLPRKKGIYAPDFGGGQVDITSGKFVFTMSEAYEIENGKIGRRSRVHPWSAPVSKRSSVLA